MKVHLKHLPIIVALLLPISTKAQRLDSIMPIKRFEVELKMGASYPLGDMLGNKRVGPVIGIEARWNHATLPMDFGVEMNLDLYSSKYDQSENNHRLFSIGMTSDYNFCRGRKCSPFIGGGIGLGLCQVTVGPSYTEGMRPMFMLRSGVELFHHLRLTLSARYARRGYNGLALTLGYSFGGGLRKNR